MDQKGSGLIKSVRTEYKKSDNKEKKNPFEKSETWVPCQNDEIVTSEMLKQLLQCEDEHHHQANLRNFVRCHLRDKETADDICQEVWATMLNKVKEEIIYLSGIKSYAGKVAYGLILNELRRRSKRKNDSIFPQCDNDKASGETEGCSFPERRTASPEVITLLKEVLNYLEPREQKIFFYDQCGYTDDEIAEELGIQTNNVRVVRYRASRRLAQYIKQRKSYEDTFGR